MKSIVIIGLAALALVVAGCGGGGGGGNEPAAAQVTETPDESNVAACNELAADFYSGDTAAKMERWTDLGCEELDNAGKLDSGEVPQEVADAWPEKWCNEVQVGMTLDEAADIMGEPTERFTDQESWYAYQWGFSAFVGSDGRIHQLDWNGVSLNEADRARLTCPETRR